MFKKLLYPVLLMALAYFLFINSDAKVIFAGIAIFLIGMTFMEEGFKLFSGGLLEKVLEKSTNSVPKAITTGFISTSIVQSSSLISVIVISFLSVNLISLSGAIGVVFGSNIGTTTTAWIVSAFGVKIKISAYAMPMIIFGAIFRFSKSNSYQGLGNILLGLGFVFLGISYMKDGFETLKAGIDLAQFAMDGYLGVLVYILIGAVSTVIIQSSSATMALIITALATNQIMYINALELAIGANIGTTITAVMASLASNANGKRLAVAHFIFNIITGLVAIVFLYQLESLVSYLADIIGIANDDFAMKLALFHTIFNVIGVLLVSPFTSYLEKFLKDLFKEKVDSSFSIKYLDEVVIEVPTSAIKSLKDETVHLYENSLEVISHALYLHRHKFLGSNDIEEIVKKSDLNLKIDINEFYSNKIKYLYSEIISYASLSQNYMNEDEKKRVYDIKLASRNLVEAIKDIRELNKNINIYLKSKNSFIKDEYNTLRINIAKVLNGIEELRKNDDDLETLSSLEVLKENIRELADLKNDRIDMLIRSNKIDKKMATSLINDFMYTYSISKKLIESAQILFIEDSKVQSLGSEI